MSSTELLQTPITEQGRFGTLFQFVTMTSLEELVAYAKERPEIHFYIELKRGALISHGIKYCLETLAKLLADLNNITLISFDRQAIKEAKTYGIKRAGVVLEHWHNKDEVIEYCQADIAYINKNHIHDNGLISAKAPIAIYEIGDPDEAQHFINRGASKIETFHIDKLLAG